MATLVSQMNDGLLIKTNTGRIRLSIVDDNIIHVTYTQQECFSTKPSLMVLPQPSANQPWRYLPADASFTLATERLQLIVDEETAAFTWCDANGQLLVKEPVNGKLLRETQVEKTVIDTDTVVTTEATIDGSRAVVRNARVVTDRIAYSTRLYLEFSDGEAIYGLGQHEEGVLNYRGHSQLLYQQNMKVAMPVIVSTRGYGILFDTCSLAGFHDDQYGSYFWTEIDDEMDFYFIYGPEFDQIVAGIRRLTGHMPMLPKWVYGYIQSKERYENQAELLAVAQEYRERGIPLDCIVQDWKYWPGEWWGQKSFEPTRFPNPKDLADQLHAENTRLMISIWPHMRNNGPDQVEMQKKGCLLANGSTCNSFDPKARALYWQQANQGLFQYGIDAWWCDCTEPFEADWKGKVKQEPWQRLMVNTAMSKVFIDPEFINAYSLVHSQGMYEGQRSVTSEKRVVNLTRSGFPGQQRYGAVTWSGDAAAKWDVLRRQIPDGLNFAMCGNPRWTFDIGAFFVRDRNLWFYNGDFPTGCEDAGYRELYVRWFQLGAFLPMFRSHGTDTPREVWQFGEPGDVAYDTLVRFAFLRYRLLPYIYSIAAWECLHDYTMLRSLAFDFRHDPQVYDIKDQFMFGPAFMVCPVTNPMYYEPCSQPLSGVQKQRSVYLPAGSAWYDFWTGKRYPGGQTIIADASLDIMPLYVRAGAVVPMGPAVQHSAEQPDAPWELRVYPGADGQFTIYEDEGDSYRYEDGYFATAHISWNDERGQLLFSARQGSFAGMVKERRFNVVLVRSGHGAGDQVMQQPDATIHYTGENAGCLINVGS